MQCSQTFALIEMILKQRGQERLVDTVTSGGMGNGETSPKMRSTPVSVIDFFIGITNGNLVWHFMHRTLRPTISVEPTKRCPFGQRISTDSILSLQAGTGPFLLVSIIYQYNWHIHVPLESKPTSTHLVSENHSEFKAKKWGQKD